MCETSVVQNLALPRQSANSGCQKSTALDGSGFQKSISHQGTAESPRAIWRGASKLAFVHCRYIYIYTHSLLLSHPFGASLRLIQRTKARLPFTVHEGLRTADLSSVCARVRSYSGTAEPPQQNHPLSPLHEPLHWRAKRDPKE